MAVSLSLQTLPATWSITLRPNIIPKPYSSTPHITTPCWEPQIKATTPKLTFGCLEDALFLLNKLENAPISLRCPVLWRSGNARIHAVTNGVEMGTICRYDPAIRGISFNNTYRNIATNNTQEIPSGYKLSGLTFTGPNSDAAGDVIDPNQEVQWDMRMFPVDRNFEYRQTNLGAPIEIEPINLIHVPNYKFSINPLTLIKSTIQFNGSYLQGQPGNVAFGNMSVVRNVIMAFRPPATINGPQIIYTEWGICTTAPTGGPRVRLALSVASNIYPGTPNNLTLSFNNNANVAAQALSPNWQEISIRNETTTTYRYAQAGASFSGANGSLPNDPNAFIYIGGAPDFPTRGFTGSFSGLRFANAGYRPIANIVTTGVENCLTPLPPDPFYSSYYAFDPLAPYLDSYTATNRLTLIGAPSGLALTGPYACPY